ncbi:MATE family efflux transporter [Dethiobacter alkaliphilus]|uniref:MATE family efflux transporter n=1 Tax=Dethiobacter alkaliphilus TaxID=427926 RepID=UPI0022270276|nr:MATE family efflux transporter [Dethiobacter alkaliphilus]MCW3490523.1 MATE family efflux transporter [Dethiobacter alkaliphilus]
MVSTKQLAEGNIPNLIMKFSGPAIVGMVVMSIYNVVDRIFIGRYVGSLGLAGVTVSFPLMTVIMALSMLVGIGATALISIRLGEQKNSEAEKVMGNALALFLLVSLVLTVFGLAFLDPLLTLFGASANVLPYARDYMQIILLGCVFQILSFGVNNFIRAEGNPHIAMFTMVIGAVLNIILDAVLILGLNMGVAGAALATIISQAVSAAYVMYYFLRGNSLLKFRPGCLRLQRVLVKEIVAVGAPAFLKQIATSLIVVILNNSLLYYGGDMAISAFGAIHSILVLILMPIFGISQGIQPIIGYNYGAKKFERVKQTLYLGILVSTGIVLAAFVAIVLVPERFIALFSTDAELVAIGSAGLRGFLAFLPIIGFQITGANYFQAVGKPRQAVFLNLSRQVLLFIPALLILPRYYGLAGIWMVGPVADFFSSVITAIWLVIEVRYLDQQEREYTLRAQFDAQ